MQNLTNYNNSGLLPLIFFYYFRSAIIQKPVILDRRVYLNPFILTHWLLNSGHKASSLSPLLHSSSNLCLSCQQPSRLLSVDDSIQDQGEASVLQSQSFHGTGNQLSSCPQPARFTSPHARQVGTCAKRHQHKLAPGQNETHQIPPSASLCPADLNPSFLNVVSLQVVPFPPGPGKASSNPGSGNITDAKLQRGKYFPSTDKSQPTGLS